jgi:N6-adenosine-specific RNA methylase IME4
VTLFQTVIADCAWRFGDPLPGPKRGANSHYHTLDVEGLKRLRLPPIHRDALLFFWRVSAMPQEALDVVKAWGFTAKSELVWVKTTEPCGPELGGYAKHHKTGASVTPSATAAFGMGRYSRLNHEVCLIAARGKAIDLVQRHDVRSVFFAPVGRHSEKPAAFYSIVEAMTEGPILELFARQERGGRYTCVGDELGKVMPVREGGLFDRLEDTMGNAGSEQAKVAAALKEIEEVKAANEKALREMAADPLCTPESVQETLAMVRARHAKVK